MRYYMSILVTIILFSTIEIGVKLIAGDIDMIFLSFIRFFLSGLVFLMLDIKKIKEFEIKDLKNLLFIAFIGITISFSFFNLSLKEIEASKAAVIFSINPVFSSLFAVWICQEKLSLQKVIGVLMGFLGVWVLNFGFHFISMKDIVGPGLMLISALGFAFYIVAAKKYIIKYGALFTTGLVFTTGSLMYLPFIKSFSILNPAKSLPVIIYLSIMATGVAYICYFYGLKHLSISAGTSMFYLKPIIATVLAVILLNEKLTNDFFFGLVLIATALTLTIFKKKKAKIKV